MKEQRNKEFKSKELNDISDLKDFKNVKVFKE